MTRSHWGWGHAEEHLDDDALRHLSGLLSAVLGMTTGPLADAVSASDARVPEPRLQAPLPFASAGRLDRMLHTWGRSFPEQVRAFQGDFAPAPDVVLHPRSEDEVQAAIDWAQAEGVALIPWGGGTSVVGGVTRPERDRPVASLDLTGLHRLLEVDRDSLSARIEAGATGPVLEAALAEHGLTLRHFPQSFEFSTLGGWIATRAGGHFATNYTHIDDLVQSVRMRTPAGVWESARLPGSGAGPSPDRLVLGSEGILGVITSAWMRVFPRPVHRAKATVHFDDHATAVRAVRAVAQARLFPSNCRLLDRREALLNQVALGSEVLLLGFESAHVPVQARLEEAIGLATAEGGRVERSEPRQGSAQDWRDAFVKGPYRQSALIRLGMVVDTFETAITWDRFDALHDDVIRSTRAAMKQVAGTGFVSCRFTHVYPDGPAPYYTFLCPGRPGERVDQWRAIKEAASEALARHGATITHHHAVGRLHRPWYDRQRPEPFADALRAAKRALDPAGSLNPGVLIDP